MSWYLQGIIFSKTYSYYNTKKLTGHFATDELYYDCFTKIFQKYPKNIYSRISLDGLFHKSAVKR